MRLLLTILIFFHITFASDLQLHTFSAKFIQTVTDETNKTLRYEGEVYFKAPNSTKWIYTKPIKKIVIYDGSKLIQIEPDLEQVTIAQIKKDLNLLALLQKAKPCKSSGLYCLEVDGKEFTITTKERTITKITYEDRMGNSVVVQFLDPQKDVKLDEKIFEVQIPKDYDTIYR